ncbi:MAG: methyltransferase domain-containing protein [archaeon]
MVSILFPGRHHILTRFQHQYLRDLIDKGVNGKKVDRIVFIVTSSNHQNTRRNPIPLYLRVMMITKLASNLPCEIKVYAIPDIEYTNKYARYVLSQIFYQSGEKYTPENSILACSSPAVIKLFEKEGFSNVPVELINKKSEKYIDLRPFEVIKLLVKSGKKWRHDSSWKKYTSESSQDIYLEYNLGDLIIEVYNDSLLGEDADITETRDYNTYAHGMDKSIEFKFNDIKVFVREGKIVDAGCATGALINYLAKEFNESDIIGIEATRRFYEYCRMQDYPSPFVFFYRRNILDQNFKEGTINTFIYSSILHEIYSYLNKAALIKLLKNTYKQLTFGGRIVIRDVVGPENPNKIVYMELNEKDGEKEGSIEKMSTYSKFFRFAKDFTRKIKFKEVKINEKKLIKLRLVDAYEYISKMSYTDNWKSEMHEEFGFWSFNDWKKELMKVGFNIVRGSKEFKNPHIIEKKYKGKVNFYTLRNNKLIEEDYPCTNMIIAGEKKD